MLFTLQRYEFFSKSQRVHCTVMRSFGCCLPYKGTNFSANHNNCSSCSCVIVDVVYPTKVRIFQQITTVLQNYKLFSKMLFTLQRYEFFSKSQPILIEVSSVARCCLPYKGTNFSANHNLLAWNAYDRKDVVYPTKVRIFQQITTASIAI